MREGECGGDVIRHLDLEGSIVDIYLVRGGVPGGRVEKKGVGEEGGERGGASAPQQKGCKGERQRRPARKGPQPGRRRASRGGR